MNYFVVFSYAYMKLLKWNIDKIDKTNNIALKSQDLPVYFKNRGEKNPPSRSLRLNWIFSNVCEKQKEI